MHSTACSESYGNMTGLKDVSVLPFVLIRVSPFSFRVKIFPSASIANSLKNQQKPADLGESPYLLPHRVQVLQCRPVSTRQLA